MPPRRRTARRAGVVDVPEYVNARSGQAPGQSAGPREHEVDLQAVAPGAGVGAHEQLRVLARLERADGEHVRPREPAAVAQRAHRRPVGRAGGPIDTGRHDGQALGCDAQRATRVSRTTDASTRMRAARAARRRGRVRRCHRRS